jgi:hypothetical protein
MKFLYTQARPTRFNAMPRRGLSLHLTLYIVWPEAVGESMACEHSIACGRFRLNMARRLWRGRAGHYRAFPHSRDAVLLGSRIQATR